MRRTKLEPARILQKIQNEPTSVSKKDDPAESLSGLSRAFVDVLPRAMLSFRAGIREAAGENFTMPQFRVMTQLRKRSCTNGELAELMGVSVPAMSRMVDGLVELGYVVRVPQDRDRRQIKLELSMEGRRRFRRLQKHIHDVFVVKFTGLDSGKRDGLLGGLNVLEELFP